MAERDPSLHILQHALGLDDYGQGDTYRNRYVVGPDCDSWDLCMAHREAGRMLRHGPSDLFGGSTSYCFTVTETGKAYVREHSPKPPKVSRAKARYRAWLKVGDLISFGDWLKNGGRCG
jgi:hypothetical protein